MSTLIKVTLEFDDKVMELEGPEAEKWSAHNAAVATLASVHGMNPFDFDPIKWKTGDK